MKTHSTPSPSVATHSPLLDIAIADMVNAFLRWPLPESVSADGCATRPGKGRSGTNLLTMPETVEMMQAVVRPRIEEFVQDMHGALEARNVELEARVAELEFSVSCLCRPDAAGKEFAMNQVNFGGPRWPRLPYSRELDVDRNASILFKVAKAEREGRALRGFRFIFSSEEEATHKNASKAMLATCWDFARLMRDTNRPAELFRNMNGELGIRLLGLPGQPGLMIF